MVSKKLMDFELLHGTHATEGTPGFRDKLASTRFIKQVNGPAVYVKDHRNLEEVFPNKFRRVYPEQMAQLAAALKPAEAVETEDVVASDTPDTPAVVTLPVGSEDVTAKFPTAKDNDFKVFQKADHTFSVVDEDGTVMADGLKGVVQVRKWLKENAEDKE